jgi:hypothetical protein
MVVQRALRGARSVRVMRYESYNCYRQRNQAVAYL